MTDVHQAVKNIGKPRGKDKEKEFEDFRLDTANFRNVVFETDVEFRRGVRCVILRRWKHQGVLSEVQH